ncbi:hypothetical protein DPEC_G00305970 [Dallia pectoralis]|uniref:Uncharacterized protein n=1 Tax=Dallia pectoralis TaxID=75939 RepID=A0ACC2FDZ2_DALPE|nr:hypothetical protein DPEC_G00305970 [Dallia pectoralis]
MHCGSPRGLRSAYHYDSFHMRASLICTGQRSPIVSLLSTVPSVAGRNATLLLGNRGPHRTQGSEVKGVHVTVRTAARNSSDRLDLNWFMSK